MSLFWDAAPSVPSPALMLAPGTFYLPQQGWYWYRGGEYSSLQRYDPIARVWRVSGDDGGGMRLVYFDGRTTRIANPTGTPSGAVVTTAGSAYTSVPTVTPSAGSSSWTAIVGGAISTAAVIGVAGSGYQYAPLLWIEQPPQLGTQAAGFTTISNGTISAVTLTNQGSGYLRAPQVAVLNDARDTAGYGGQVSVALTGAGTVTGVVCTNPGLPITSGTVPTLTFGSGAGAATVVMDWSVSSVSISAAGAGYTGAAGAVTASGAGGFVSTTPAYLGGFTSTGMTRWREAKVNITTNASGGLSAVANTLDGGRYQGIPTPTIVAAQQYTTVGTLVFTMGGLNTTVFLMPAQQ